MVLLAVEWLIVVAEGTFIRSYVQLVNMSATRDQGIVILLYCVLPTETFRCF